MGSELTILAVLVVRNGEPYIRRCLDHLIGQDIGVHVIDHGSTDRTRALAEDYAGQGVVAIEGLPFEGDSSLRDRLEAAKRVLDDASAEWLIRCDVDEIMEPPVGFRTLREGIEAADRGGWNAINFDEFVFVPTADDEDHAGGDYVATMKRYYFHKPVLYSLMRGCKKSISRTHDFVKSGGHHLHGAGLRPYPENFVLRHYIVLSRRHLLRKYLGRAIPLDQVRQYAWSKDRDAIRPRDLVLPEPERLKLIDPAGNWAEVTRGAGTSSTAIVAAS